MENVVVVVGASQIASRPKRGARWPDQRWLRRMNTTPYQATTRKWTIRLW